MAHTLVPASVRPSTWWAQLDLTDSNPIGAAQLLEVDSSPSTWIAWSVMEESLYESPTGYATFLPTSTDCLWWFRWVLLPWTDPNSYIWDYPQPTGETVSLTGAASELAEQIDGARGGDKAEDLLRALSLEQLEGARADGGWGVRRFCSIHEFVSDGAATLGLDGIRHFLSDDEMVIDNGQWGASEKAWRTLYQRLGESGFDGNRFWES